MTPEQLVAVLVALTGLLGALGILIRQVGELRKDLNGRMEQFLVSTRDAAHRQGEMAGRDWMAAQAVKEPQFPGAPVHSDDDPSR